MNHTTEQSTQEIPYGFCHCGCGQKTKIATRSRARKGHVEGKPLKFILGHSTRAYDRLESPNPTGLCMCGCGKLTRISKKTSTTRLQVKGKPLRFIYGHVSEKPKKKVEPPRYKSKDRKIPVATRFWKKVAIGAPDQCWEWQGAKQPTGYGKLGIDRQTIGAHRVSYELHNGPIPDGFHVCHKCDNPPCVNPAHLVLGTAAENHADKTQKGRANPPRQDGSKYRGKFTKEDVLSIRQRHANGESARLLAKEYGATTGAVEHIVKRLSWKHI